MNKEKIEETVRRLQKEILRNRMALHDGAPPPVEKIFVPEVAAKVLRIEYAVEEELGRFGNDDGRFEVAGLLDRSAKRIAVSRRFKKTTVLFTGAHEIGHWDLHKHMMRPHRDLPIHGISDERVPRSREEREADYYAACYRVPRGLLAAAFEARFSRMSEFRFDDDAAFGLCPSNPNRLMTSDNDSLERELALSSAITYWGSPHFDSLSEMFGVSDLTMAIRLREIGLRA